MSNYLDIFDSVDCERSELSEKRVLPSRAEEAIRAWLAHIRETDPAIIDEVLGKCADDPEALAYYMTRSAEVPPVRRLVGRTVGGVQVFAEEGGDEIR